MPGEVTRRRQHDLPLRLVTGSLRQRLVLGQQEPLAGIVVDSHVRRPLDGVRRRHVSILLQHPLVGARLDGLLQRHGIRQRPHQLIAGCPARKDFGQHIRMDAAGSGGHAQRLQPVNHFLRQVFHGVQASAVNARRRDAAQILPLARQRLSLPIADAGILAVATQFGPEPLLQIQHIALAVLVRRQVAIFRQRLHHPV